MPQIIENLGDVLEIPVADAHEMASHGYGGGEQSEVSKLLALMHQASKTRYLIRTIPACNSDE